MKLGRVGIGLTVLCAIHCLSLPLLASTATVLHGTALDHPWTEMGLLGSVAVIGYSTLGSAFRRHGRPQPLGLLTVGLAVMLLAHFVLPHALETVGMLLGVVALIGAQVLNGRCVSACCPAPCCAPSEAAATVR